MKTDPNTLVVVSYSPVHDNFGTLYKGTTIFESSDWSRCLTYAERFADWLGEEFGSSRIELAEKLVEKVCS